MLRFLSIVFLLSGICSIPCLGQVNDKPGEFTFSGYIKGRDTGILVLGYINREGINTMDTSKVDKGFFKFQGTVSQPTFAHFTGSIKSRSFDDPNRMQVFLEAGDMKVEVVEGQFKTLKVSGSGTQLEYDSLEKIRRKFLDANKKRRISLDFILSQPNSFVSPFLLTGFINSISLDSLRKIYAGFSLPVRESMFGKGIARAIENLSLSAVGGKAYDFTTKDWKGKQFHLAQFRGKKYVLLDFWASWCVPCHKQSVELKRIYERYHAKDLEIIGVSGDSNDEVWMKAILADKVEQWQHVSSGRGRNVTAEEDLENKFAISAYPTLVLIDKEGKIVFREEGYRDELRLKKLEDKLVTLLETP